jgi:hypothetical protein
MHLIEVVEEGAKLVDEAFTVDGHAGGLLQLSGDHDQRDAGHVSDEDRA